MEILVGMMLVYVIEQKNYYEIFANEINLAKENETLRKCILSSIKAKRNDEGGSSLKRNK